MRYPFLRRLSVPFLALTTATAAADVVTIEASKDNTLYEENVAFSNGAGDHVFCGSTNLGTLRRAVVEFDLSSSVPPGSVVTDAVLDLHMSLTIVGPEAVSIHRAGEEWGEGLSHANGEEGAGGPVLADDATWMDAFFGVTPWATTGGSFDRSASATTNVDWIGHYLWSGAAVVADVQAWVDDPASNHGWFVLGDEASPAPTAKRFDAVQNTDPTVRPMLTVTFTPPSVPLYCTPKTSSAGCVTQISTTNPGFPPVSGAFDYEVTASSVQGGKNGLVFLGVNGPASLAFNGGVLCMFPPLKRGPIQFAGGSSATSCDGSYSTLVNGLSLPVGLDPGSGNSGWFQYWYRDPQNGAGNLGTALSDAIQLDYL